MIPEGLDLRTVGEYMVAVDVRQTDWGEVTHLEIARKDNRPIHEWYELLKIKDEVCGEERVAFEVYPARSRLVDAQHAYHLWVMPPGFRVPFGIHELDNAPHEHCLHRMAEEVKFVVTGELRESVPPGTPLALRAVAWLRRLASRLEEVAGGGYEF